MKWASFILDPTVWPPPSQREFVCTRIKGHPTRCESSSWLHFAPMSESSDLNISVQIDWMRCETNWDQTLPKLYCWLTNLALWNKLHCSMGGALTACCLGDGILHFSFDVSLPVGRESVCIRQTFIWAKREKSTLFFCFSNLETLFFYAVFLRTKL